MFPKHHTSRSFVFKGCHNVMGHGALNAARKGSDILRSIFLHKTHHSSMEINLGHHHTLLFVGKKVGRLGKVA